MDVRGNVKNNLVDRVFLVGGGEEKEERHTGTEIR